MFLIYIFFWNSNTSKDFQSDSELFHFLKTIKVTYYNEKTNYLKLLLLVIIDFGGQNAEQPRPFLTSSLSFFIDVVKIS